MTKIEQVGERVKNVEHSPPSNEQLNFKSFKEMVQSVKSIHQYFRFFGKELSISRSYSVELKSTRIRRDFGYLGDFKIWLGIHLE